jgi:hypothetical protein
MKAFLLALALVPIPNTPVEHQIVDCTKGCKIQTFIGNGSVSTLHFKSAAPIEVWCTTDP